MAAPAICVVLCGLLGSVVSQPINLEFQMLEEKPKGDVIASLKGDAKLDSIISTDEMRSLEFSYLSFKKYLEYFHLDDRSGVLSVAKKLDRDVECPGKKDCIMELNVAAKTDNDFFVIKLVIKVLDKNDNPPRFPEGRVRQSVSESTHPGVLFPIMTAVDPDSPDNGIVRYHLASDSPFRLKVKQNSDGTMDLHLKLASRLDRERQDFYRIEVVAFDGGIPSKSGSVTIDITVTDVNDNSPVFTNATYRKKLHEDRPIDSSVITVHANDPDAGTNGDVKYSFTKRTAQQFGSFFRIDSETGTIYLLRELDHETHDVISLYVQAKDMGTNPVATTAIVELTIVDVNDNPPRITSEMVGSVSIDEHCKLHSFVAHFSVHDPDSSDAGRVECYLNDEQHFKLEQTYGSEYTIFTNAMVDREIQDQYSIILQCHDFGQPQQASFKDIIVNVKDINDHKPVFSQAVYNFTIEEEISPVAVGIVRATDADEGKNGEVVYYLQRDAGEKFQIDPKKGLITVVSALDREVEGIIEFHVLASDKADESVFSSAVVSITLLDRDDEAPIFNQPKYIFEISENQPALSWVGAVKANDNDLPPHNAFGYYIEGKEGSSALFSVDPLRGEIYTKVPLNREQGDVHHISIMALSDHSVPRKQDIAHIDIFVTDKNDNFPIIHFPASQNETVYIENNAELGAVVTTVEAHDMDKGSNAVLTYLLSRGSENGEFVIQHKTGQILVNKDLSEYDQAVFRLEVTVRDGGTPNKKSSSATINVVVSKGLVATRQIDHAALPIAATHLAIIVGAILGCLLIAIILVVAILVIRRKNREHSRPPPPSYWPKSEMLSGRAAHDGGKEPLGIDRDDGRNDGSALPDTGMGIKADLFKQKPQLCGKEDADSGCADISHSESQGSCEDDMRKGTYSIKGKRMESFSEWLNSESYHLNQKGNSYRVNDNVSGTLGRKAVRFTEPQRLGETRGANDYTDEPCIPRHLNSATSSPFKDIPTYATQPHGVYGGQGDFYGTHPATTRPAYSISQSSDDSTVIVNEGNKFSTFQAPNTGGSLV